MLSLLATILLVQSAGFFYFTRWLALHLSKVAGEENTRLVLLASEAMANIKAGTVEAKVKAEALRKQYDLQLEYYKDTVAKDVAASKKKKSTTEPIWATTDDGRKVDLNDLDILG